MDMGILDFQRILTQHQNLKVGSTPPPPPPHPMDIGILDFSKFELSIKSWKLVPPTPPSPPQIGKCANHFEPPTGGASFLFVLRNKGQLYPVFLVFYVSRMAWQVVPDTEQDLRFNEQFSAKTYNYLFTEHLQQIKFTLQVVHMHLRYNSCFYIRLKTGHMDV